MYTRSYFTEDKKPIVPENYDGNAFREEIAPTLAEVGDATEGGESAVASSSGTVFSSLLTKLPLGGLFGSLPFSRSEGEKAGRERVKIGTEEILICLVALYMFFSKEGDKECAIMLLLLLFIR